MNGVNRDIKILMILIKIKIRKRKRMREMYHSLNIIGQMKINDILKLLDKMIPNPKSELNYNKDYELLIATVLSAQCTDARVNKVTSVLFKKYDINSLAEANI